MPRFGPRLPWWTALLVLGVAALVPSTVGAQEGSGGSDTGLRVACQQLTCTFDGRAVGSEAEVDRYSWAFGDGDTATGPVVNHTYGSAGAYTVTLTLTMADGQEQTRTRTVHVGGGTGGAEPGSVPWTSLALGLLAFAGSVALARAT